jgi:acetyl esterase/lipase
MSIGVRLVLVWGLLIAVGSAFRVGETYAQDDEMITIPYAEYPDSDANLTSLDLYPLSGSEDYPIVIYVHGGGWAIGDKSNVVNMPTFFRAAGYGFVSVNYRLTPDVEFPTHAEDVAAAIAWVHDNIAAYGGDPTRLYLMGHSAGAHLVALVATDARYLNAHEMGLMDIRAVAPLDTQTYDFQALAESNRGRLGEVYTNTFTDDPEFWEFASPITYVAPDQGIPPMVVVYSGGTTQSFPDPERGELSEAFVMALQEAGIDATLAPSPDQTHDEIRRNFGREGDEVALQVLAFFNRY